MNKILNNLLKGLGVALVVVTISGFITLHFKTPSPNTLILISSSMINTLTTNDTKEIEENQTEDVNLELKEENNLEIEKEEVQLNSIPVINAETKEPEEPKQEEIDKTEEVSVQGVYAPNLEVASTYSAIETYYGKMTGYGPDCVGCSGITASGMNVLNGNIYYNDKTFGNIRIVAGDKSIPFGSIIRITGINISSDPVIAIVLDRGGMIGFAEGKHAYFDLLYQSEGAAYSFGRQDATFELLRSGY